MATKYTFRENVLRVVAVIGLIAVLLLGAWGIIQLAFFIPDFLSGLANGTSGSDKKESLVVSMPATITASQAFPISWNHKNGSGQYSYALSYSCATGLSVQAPLPTGAAQEVPCNTPFNYINATNTTPLIFTLKGTKSVPVTVKVTATKLSSGKTGISGSANSTVNPSASVVTPAKTPSKTPAKTPAKTSSSKPSTKYVASGRTQNLYGLSDLRVQILRNPGSVAAGSQVSLQFSIENVGTNVTPQNWSFTASLPYAPVYTFQSQGQQALYPGDKIVYTLGYNAAYPAAYNQYDPAAGWAYTPDQSAWSYGGTYGAPGAYGYLPAQAGGLSTASVSVDPYNLVPESNESNNYAAVSYQVY